MTLEYKILWIEDDPQSIKRDKKQIKKYIEDLGFSFNIQDIIDFKRFEDEVGYKKTSDFDLLLIDLNLGDENNKGGEDIIRSIRKENIYTEIIFYSSLYEELQKKLNENFVEGVFTSSRTELADKVKKIIDLTVEKVQDVNNLRGLIMAEVSELDRIKERIIKKYIPSATSDFKEYVQQKNFSNIKTELEKLEHIVEVKDSNYDFTKINLGKFVDSFFYDTFKKSRTVFKIKNDECQDNEFVHEDYKRDIINKRNVLAHEDEKTCEQGKKYLLYPDKQEKLDFTTEHCIQIRKDIKKYKALLEDIEKRLE